jgi:hypothetical protein
LDSISPVELDQAAAVSQRRMNDRTARANVADSLVGSVVAASDPGRGLPGALVTLVGFKAGLRTLASAHTDDTGRFELHLPNPESFRDCRAFGFSLQASAPGFSERHTVIPADGLDAGAREQYTLVLAVGGDLRGVVLGPDGAPVDHARVQVQFRLAGAEEGQRVLVNTNLAGGYLVPVSQAGEYTIFAEAQGIGSGSLAPIYLDGQSSYWSPPLLLTGPRGITGRLLGPNGAPVVGKGIQANLVSQVDMPDGVTSGFAVTDQEGSFEIQGLCSGEFGLRTGQVAILPQVSSTTNEYYTLRLTGYKLVVTLETPSKEPVLILRPDGRPTILVDPNHLGEYVLYTEVSGVYVARCEGYAEQLVPLESPQAVYSVVLRRSVANGPTGALRLRIAGVGAGGAGHARIEVRRGRARVRSEIAEIKGTLLLPGLSPGRVQVTWEPLPAITRQVFQPEIAIIDILPNETVEWALRPAPSTGLCLTMAVDDAERDGFTATLRRTSDSGPAIRLTAYVLGPDFTTEVTSEFRAGVATVLRTAEGPLEPGQYELKIVRGGNAEDVLTKEVHLILGEMSMVSVAHWPR